MEHKFGAKPIVFGALGLLVIVSFCIVFFSLTGNSSKVTIGENSFDTYTAMNETDRSKVLLGSSGVTSKDKMLLVFPEDGVYPVSLKNATKPIDILWLDSNKKIIYIQTTTQSEIGKNVNYKSTKPARYIIELPAGSVGGYAIKVNQIAEFNIKTEDVK